jgi:hypothetical protein
MQWLMRAAALNVERRLSFGTANYCVWQLGWN